MAPEPLSRQITPQRADAGQRSVSGPGRPTGGVLGGDKGSWKPQMRSAIRQERSVGDRPPVSCTGHRRTSLFPGNTPDTGKGASLESAEQDRLSSWRGTRDMGQGAGKREPGGDEPGEDEPEFYQQ